MPLLLSQAQRTAINQLIEADDLDAAMFRWITSREHDILLHQATGFLFSLSAGGAGQCRIAYAPGRETAAVATLGGWEDILRHVKAWLGNIERIGV